MALTTLSDYLVYLYKNNGNSIRYRNHPVDSDYWGVYMHLYCSWPCIASSDISILWYLKFFILRSVQSSPPTQALSHHPHPCFHAHSIHGEYLSIMLNKLKVCRPLNAPSVHYQSNWQTYFSLFEFSRRNQTQMYCVPQTKMTYY